MVPTPFRPGPRMAARLPFAREVDGNLDIYIMNVDGSNVQRLTQAPGPDSLPVFTPTATLFFAAPAPALGHLEDEQ